MSKVDDFSIRLKALIEARYGGTWGKLAKAAGIGTGTFTPYIKGTGAPNFEQLTRIIEVSGVNPTWLLTGEGEMFPPHEHDLANWKTRALKLEEDMEGMHRMALEFQTTAKELEKRVEVAERTLEAGWAAAPVTETINDPPSPGASAAADRALDLLVEPVPEAERPTVRREVEALVLARARRRGASGEGG